MPRSFRDAELAVERVPRRAQLAYEDFDLATLVLSEVPPEHIRPRVDELMAPLRANPPLLEALVEYFARDMDVNATAEAMHVHPNTLRYRLGARGEAARPLAAPARRRSPSSASRCSPRRYILRMHTPYVCRSDTDFSPSSRGSRCTAISSAASSRPRRGRPGR